MLRQKGAVQSSCPALALYHITPNVMLRHGSTQGRIFGTSFKWRWNRKSGVYMSKTPHVLIDQRKCLLMEEGFAFARRTWTGRGCSLTVAIFNQARRAKSDRAAVLAKDMATIPVLGCNMSRTHPVPASANCFFKSATCRSKA